MVGLEDLVSPKHQYRQFKKLFNFKEIESELRSVKSGIAIKLIVLLDYLNVYCLIYGRFKRWRA
ncbi:MAG: hypothetical protein AB8B66_03795 [Rickettsiaceae bacterium]